MTGACEGLDPAMGAQLSDAVGGIDGVAVRGVAMVRRASNVHVILVADYPNATYAPKLEDVQRLAIEYAKGQATGDNASTIELRDGGAALGGYGAIHYATKVEKQVAFLDYFPFFGNTSIHVVQITTVGDEPTALAFGRDLIATVRASSNFVPRTAETRKDVSELLSKVLSYTIVGSLAGIALWVGRKRRK